MTKAQELKVLDQIEALIKSAGEDSYIGPTFAGIVDICRSNIENDFGDHPLEDLEAARKKAVDLAKIAMDITDERDKLKEDFDELAGAYRKALEASDAARPYAIAEWRTLRNEMDSLPAEADETLISSTFRAMKKADRAVHLTAEVQEDALRKPFCYAAHPDKTPY